MPVGALMNICVQGWAGISACDEDVQNHCLGKGESVDSQPIGKVRNCLITLANLEPVHGVTFRNIPGSQPEDAVGSASVSAK